MNCNFVMLRPGEKCKVNVKCFWLFYHYEIDEKLNVE